MKFEDLPLEARFTLAGFPVLVERLNETQTKRMLVSVYKQMLLTDATYKQLIGQRRES